MPADATSILVVRGRHPTPWALRPWESLSPRFAVRYLQPRRTVHDTSSLDLEAVPVRTRLERLTAVPGLAVAADALPDRFVGAGDAFASADVVHAEELSYWFSGDAAERRRAGGFKLVQTVWETIPLLEAYRNPPARRQRRRVLDATDLFLPTTERARDALLLEGVEPGRIVVCPPGIDRARFAPRPGHTAPAEHVILSPARLVWEKGHQDVLRAAAALHRGVVGLPGGAAPPRVVIVGRGPEEGRLRAHADELGIGHAVEIRGAVPYDEMPALYADASCLVLASLPAAGAALWPGDRPRAFWEEQFGMVLAEALAAGLDVVATRSGAIPEVLGGAGTVFDPGDWRGLAERLAAGPLARPPGQRVDHPPQLVERYSVEAMAARLEHAYDLVLGR